VLVDEESNIIAGHGRVLAAQSLGLAEVPVMVAAGWSPEQKRAYVIADNKLALNAGWDEEILRFELGELRDLGVDLALTGFDLPELGKLFGAEDGLTDPDETPDAPTVPVSSLGDVWLLGRHRIVCGDCTDAAVVENALNGVTPHLMVTDPPYGVDYDPNWRNEAARTSPGMGNRALGAGAIGKVLNDNRADWAEAWALFPGDVAYVWHGALHVGVVLDSLLRSGFSIRSQVIWDKTRLIIGRGDYHWQHEPCWYAVRTGKTGQWQGDRKQTTVWQIPHQKSETGHGTQKPVECMRRPIENNSSPGQAVYEPFSGSGTTIIAGEMTGRAVHAIELNPAYVDVAVERWENFTGGEAKLEETGEAFAKVAERRKH
jgi:DNA modification methylase